MGRIIPCRIFCSVSRASGSTRCRRKPAQSWSYVSPPESRAKLSAISPSSTGGVVKRVPAGEIDQVSRASLPADARRSLPRVDRRVEHQAARATITSGLTSEGSSPGSMLGSCGASSRTDASGGAVLAGSSYRGLSYMERWGLSAYPHFSLARPLRPD